MKEIIQFFNSIAFPTIENENSKLVKSYRLLSFNPFQRFCFMKSFHSYSNRSKQVNVDHIFNHIYIYIYIEPLIPKEMRQKKLVTGI